MGHDSPTRSYPGVRQLSLGLLQQNIQLLTASGALQPQDFSAGSAPVTVPRGAAGWEEPECSAWSPSCSLEHGIVLFGPCDISEQRG